MWRERRLGSSKHSLMDKLYTISKSVLLIIMNF